MTATNTTLLISTASNPSTIVKTIDSFKEYFPIITGLPYQRDVVNPTPQKINYYKFKEVTITENDDTTTKRLCLEQQKSFSLYVEGEMDGPILPFKVMKSNKGNPFDAGAIKPSIKIIASEDNLLEMFIHQELSLKAAFVHNIHKVADFFPDCLTFTYEPHKLPEEEGGGMGYEVICIMKDQSRVPLTVIQKAGKVPAAKWAPLLKTNAKKSIVAGVERIFFESFEVKLSKGRYFLTAALKHTRYPGGVRKYRVKNVEPTPAMQDINQWGIEIPYLVKKDTGYKILEGSNWATSEECHPVKADRESMHFVGRASLKVDQLSIHPTKPSDLIVKYQAESVYKMPEPSIYEGAAQTLGMETIEGEEEDLSPKKGRRGKAMAAAASASPQREGENLTEGFEEGFQAATD